MVSSRIVLSDEKMEMTSPLFVTMNTHAAMV